MEGATAATRIATRWRAGTAGYAGPIAAWAMLIAAGYAWGTAINQSGGGIGLGAPPLFGSWDFQPSPAFALPVAYAALVVAVAPRLTRDLRWRPLLVVGAAGALGWSLALALTAGPGGLLDPLTNETEYLAGLPFVSSPGDYLATFTERIDAYPTHVRGHPPGLVMAFWALEQIGLGGAGPASVAVILVAASAVPATLIAGRAVAGEDRARRAAPFLVLAPGAVWVASSGDGLYMGVGAWAVALTVLAIEARRRRSTLLAIGGGLLFAACAFFSYGLVLLGLVPAAVAVARRRLGPILVVAGVVAIAVLVVWAASGFWWIEGFFAIREQYLAGISPSRPYDYFLLNNLAAFAIAAGPVLAAALGRIRITVAWALPLGALAAVAAADVSGMSKAEVERIWLPFLPWALLAAGALDPGRSMRALLAAGAGVGIIVELGVRMPW